MDVYVKKKASVLHLTETGSGQEASDSWRRALGLTGGLVDDPQRTGRVSECPCVCETRGDNPEQDLLRRGSWRDRAKGQVTHTHAHTHTHTHTEDRVQLVFQIFPSSPLDRHTHD